MQVIPSGAALGAEIRGVDLSIRLDDDALYEIRTAWRDHLVIVFRGQRIDDEQLIAFSERLGVLDPPGPNPYGRPIYPKHPQLNVISNIVENDRAIGNLGAGEAAWHADMTYNEVPPKAGLLYAVELPPDGGNTQFANLRSAYDALAPATRQQIEGQRAIHDASTNSAGLRRKGYSAVTDVRDTPGAHQPLVRFRPRHRAKVSFSRPATWELRARPRRRSERPAIGCAGGPMRPRIDLSLPTVGKWATC